MVLKVGRGAVSVALLAGLALCQAGPLEAARFSVNPTQVVLSGRVTSAMLTLRNESTEPLRFQLTVSAWDQTPDGEMKLRDTDDVVFFPQLLTLAPGEERKARVAVADATVTVEKTYRLFVEELPPAEQPNTPGMVRVLTRMGIPIFVQPAKVQLRGELRETSLAGNRVVFTVANTGNAHFVPEDLVLRAFSPQGQPLGQRRVDGWYILAGGQRRFSIDLAGVAKGAVAEWTVECRAGDAVLKQRLASLGQQPRS